MSYTKILRHSCIIIAYILFILEYYIRMLRRFWILAKGHFPADGMVWWFQYCWNIYKKHHLFIDTIASLVSGCIISFPRDDVYLQKKKMKRSFIYCNYYSNHVDEFKDRIFIEKSFVR